MRAAIWNGPGSMEVGSAQDAVCPEDGVLLHVLACGICGTDVRSFYNGDRRIEPPWVLGHEISGEVLEIGPRAEAEVGALSIAVGDPVHCISTLWCGRCRMCRSAICPRSSARSMQSASPRRMSGSSPTLSPVRVSITAVSPMRGRYRLRRRSRSASAILTSRAGSGGCT